MTQNTAHEELCNKVLFILGSNPDIRAFKRKVGLAVPVHSQSSRPIMFGYKGEPDISGFVRGGASWFAEIKTGKAVLSPDQKNWQTMCLNFGIDYAVIRDENEALQFREQLLGLVKR
jgi:hypothetical protein